MGPFLLPTCFGLQSLGDTSQPHLQLSWISTLTLVQTSSWTPGVTVTGVTITGTSLVATEAGTQESREEWEWGQEPPHLATSTWVGAERL